MHRQSSPGFKNLKKTRHRNWWLKTHNLEWTLERLLHGRREQTTRQAWADDRSKVSQICQQIPTFWNLMIVIWNHDKDAFTCYKRDWYSNLWNRLWNLQNFKKSKLCNCKSNDSMVRVNHVLAIAGHYCL